MKLYLLLTVFLLPTLLSAAPYEKTWQKLLQEKAECVTWVSLTMRVEVSAGGRSMPPQEQKLEALGTVLAEDGLTVLSLSTVDPRAKILKSICQKVLKHVGVKNDPILKLAMDLEKIALNDKYFKDKRLYPNVDFYSGIILRAIGFPPEMFTVIFAIARTAGWTAQWTEMIEDPIQKIGRPRQLYTGKGITKYGVGRSSKNTR